MANTTDKDLLTWEGVRDFIAYFTAAALMAASVTVFALTRDVAELKLKAEQYDSHIEASVGTRDTVIENSTNIKLMIKQLDRIEGKLDE